MNNQYIPDYTERDALAEALRQTERHLEEQQRLTGAADQRAVAFAAVQIVVIGILLGNSTPHEVAETRLYVAFLLLISVGLAIFSARPTRIFGSGGTGESLKEYLKDRCEGYLLATLIARNDRNIEHNDGVLKSSAWVFRASLLVALFAALLLLDDWTNTGAFAQKTEGES